jgi:pyrimidine deaminase RibD-like protein
MITGERARELMQEAIAEAARSHPEDEGIYPREGAILVNRQGGIIARAHRGETGSGDHAEFIVLGKAAGRDLSDAMLFVTLEPCTSREPGKTPCAQRILESGVGTVYIGMLDPNRQIRGQGEFALRWSNVSVEIFPDILVKELQGLNAVFVNLHRSSHLPSLPCPTMRCAGRLTVPVSAAVDMTSDVKGCSQLFMSSSSVPISSCCPSEEAEPVRHDG